MESVSLTSPSQSTDNSKRIDILSLGIAFVKEIREHNLNSDEIKGLLKLINNLLRKEGLL